MNKIKYITDAKGADSHQKSPPPLYICIVINILYYLKPFSRLIIAAEPLDNIGSEVERAAFIALKNILYLLENGKNDPINIYPFLDKFCHLTKTNFQDFEGLDVSFIWDSMIKLITAVIPPLRELFLGRISSSMDIPGWLNLISRCFHAQFNYPAQTLEEEIRETLLNQDSDFYEDFDDDDYDDDEDEDDEDVYDRRSAAAEIRNFNAKILRRAPEILVFAVESAHLPLALRFTEIFNKTSTKSRPPQAIRFPASFDINSFISSVDNELDNIDQKPSNKRATRRPIWYDVTSVVSLEGAGCETVNAFYRSFDNSNDVRWFKGSGAQHEEVDTTKAIDKNYFNATDSKRVHPRLLIYVKRDINNVLDRLRDYVTKAGQMRSLGDVTFESAETPEHYDEARHYYEEAIAYDESLRPLLQERLNSLEQIERNQKAQSYENQADISLGKRRFKEACDLYKIAMRSAVVNSPLYLRIREKEDSMMKIISLEIANHLTEKGEDCIKAGSYSQAREHFAQSLKLNPNYIHLQTIIGGIDKIITAQTSAQKISEGHQAMKVGKYKYANQLFLEAIVLVPEKAESLKNTLEGLVVLMQGEDALIKQRSGLIALEDKKYSLAISCITEAIVLLPPESVVEHAFFLCDRAQVYFEMKDYQTAIKDCTAALQLRPELAIAYLRLGAAQFELENYEEALASYEKAIKYDSSLGDQVKVKVRQVRTAQEVLERKQREAERARIKELGRKQLEEKKAREEQQRKERAERQAREAAEKAERALLKEEERRARALLSKEELGAKERNKQAEKEKQKKEKAQRDLIRAQERERAKAEKERERERQKQEKEAKAEQERLAKQEELTRQREFAAEMERAQARQKEIEREKELEREKARLEREKVIAEREKARREKLAEAKRAKEEAESKAAEETAALTPSTPTSTPSAPSSAVKGSSSKSVWTGATVLTVAEDFPSLSVTAAANTNRSSGDSGSGGEAFWSGQTPRETGKAVRSSSVGSNSSETAQTKWSSIIANEEPRVRGGPSSRQSKPPVTLNEFPPLSEAVTESAQSSSGAPAALSWKAAGGEFLGGSRAWADHERAMLEATADRISEPGSAVDTSFSSSLSVQMTTSTTVVEKVKIDPTPKKERTELGKMESLERDLLGGSLIGSLIGDSKPNSLSIGNPENSLTNQGRGDQQLFDQLLGPIANLTGEFPPHVPTSSSRLNLGSIGIGGESGVSFLQTSSSSSRIQQNNDLNLGISLQGLDLGPSSSSAIPSRKGPPSPDVLFSNAGNDSKTFDKVSKGSPENRKDSQQNDLTGLLGSSSDPPFLGGSGPGGEDSFSLGLGIGGSKPTSPDITGGNNSNTMGDFGGLWGKSNQLGGGSVPMGLLQGSSMGQNSVHGFGGVDLNMGQSPTTYDPSLPIAPSLPSFDSSNNLFASLGGDSLFGNQDLKLGQGNQDINSLLSGGIGSSSGFSSQRFGQGSSNQELNSGGLNLNLGFPSESGNFPSFGSSSLRGDDSKNLDLLSLSAGKLGNTGTNSHNSSSGALFPSHNSGALGTSSGEGNLPGSQFNLLSNQSNVSGNGSTLDLGFVGLNGGSSMKNNPGESSWSSLMNLGGSSQISGNRGLNSLDSGNTLGNITAPSPRQGIFGSSNGNTPSLHSISPALSLGMNGLNNDLMLPPSTQMDLNSQHMGQPMSPFLSGLSPDFGGLGRPMQQISPSPSYSSIAGLTLLPPAQTAPVQMTGSRGIIIEPASDLEYPSVAWLRQYQMNLYRWSGEKKEWTELALHLPPGMFELLLGTEEPVQHATVLDLNHRSGARVWLESEVLQGAPRNFLIIHRGIDDPINQAAAHRVLDLISFAIKQKITTQAMQGNIKNNISPETNDLQSDISISLNNPNALQGGGSNSFLDAVLLPSPSINSDQDLSAIHANLPSTPGSEIPTIKYVKVERPKPLSVAKMPGNDYVQRHLEIPREAVGLIIGQGGKKIKELCTDSGAKIQFRVNKTAERENRPAMLEVQGSLENVDKGLHLIWDLLQLLGKEYNEVLQSAKAK